MQPRSEDILALGEATARELGAGWTAKMEPPGIPSTRCVLYGGPAGMCLQLDFSGSGRTLTITAVADYNEGHRPLDGPHRMEHALRRDFTAHTIAQTIALHFPADDYHAALAGWRTERAAEQARSAAARRCGERLAALKPAPGAQLTGGGVDPVRVTWPTATVGRYSTRYGYPTMSVDVIGSAGGEEHHLVARVYGISESQVEAILDLLGLPDVAQAADPWS